MENLCNINNEHWPNIFSLAFLSCTETELQNFQYKIVHRIFPCQHWLYNCKVIDSPQCLRCNDDDTLMHYFCQCGNLESFWNLFIKWWLRLTNNHILFNAMNILLGLYVSDCDCTILNYCIILAKFYIYINKKTSRYNIQFSNFLIYLKQRLTLKECYAKQSFSVSAFKKKWSCIYDNL